VSTVVKICGITSLEDGLAAVRAGADLIGFVFAPSPRRIEPDAAAAISAALPPGVGRVGVFVYEKPERIRTIALIAGLTVVQLYCSEPPETDELVGLPVLWAIRMRDLEPALTLARSVPGWDLLIEPLVPGRAGGTGTVLELALARRFVDALPERRVFLAGGLGPDNVREAIASVRPYGVDASSRLEASPGRKDPELVRRFVAAARSV
jgi:phosphoribosylanthranilate isomerase